MRNEYLELTLLPELGGRIYQCRFLPTGQNLFYNNAVIKPTHWGPLDQGWWLAVGGMEFALPVDEHGYVTAQPWTPEIQQAEDGSATVTMHVTEESRHIEASVAITLRPGEAAFAVRSTLENPDAEPKSFQYWINAMLSPGAHGIRPSLRVIYPTDEMIVHSRGDRSLPNEHERMPWPVYQGRDLSLYANWREWLGVFVADPRASYTAVYDPASELGVVRVFPADIARGVKLFGFGLGFGDTGVYTDDGSQYIEMWGGLTPTFWDYATLGGHERVTWEETWFPVSRTGGVSTASQAGVLFASVEDAQLALALFSPREQTLVLRATQGEQSVWSERVALTPERPFEAMIDLSAGNTAAVISVHMVDDQGNLVMRHTIQQ
jgi:hypothetical protein